MKPREVPAGETGRGGRPGTAPGTPRRLFDTVRENLEAIVVAVVLALIIRHFSVEAFEIPTGSMAPTLFGIHAWVECPNCSTDFNLGLGPNVPDGDLSLKYREVTVYRGKCPQCKLPHHRAPARLGQEFRCPFDQFAWKGAPGDFRSERVYTSSRSGAAGDFPLQCPICWFEFREVISSRNRTGGHKILVDKFTFKLGPPQRWDVIVFQFDRQINYIKRLIGKPGERVLLRRGDVFVNGQIERKHSRPEVQEALWTKVHDLEVPERGYQRTPAWKEVFPPGEPVAAGSWIWDSAQRRFSVNSAERGPARAASLKYQRPIQNFYAYNLLRDGSEGPPEEVGDKKVSFRVRIPRGGKGWVGAEIRDAAFTFQVRVPVGKPDPGNPATLRLVSGETLLASVPAALPPDSLNRVEFENVDDRVAVRLEGKEILAHEYESGEAGPRGPAENTLLLLAGDGAACVVESIQVFRDIHYTQNGDYGVKEEVVLASDGPSNLYFPCGDNSPASSDGRYWHSVPERNLMGRALLVFWPLWPTNWQFKFIR